MRKLLPFLPILLLAAGCHSDETVAHSDVAPTGPKVTAPSTPPAPAGTNNPTKPTPESPEGSETIPKATQPDRSNVWAGTSITPQQIAADVGRAMANLKDTKGDITVAVVTPEGTGGLNQQLKIKDNKHFDINYVEMQRQPQHCSVTANGKQKQEIVAGQWKPAVPLDKPLPDATESPEAQAMGWDRQFSRTMWFGLTDGKDPWKSVISEWLHGTGGYNVTAQERHTMAEGHDFVDYRIQAERTSAAAAKLGTSTIQIVIDAMHHLPTTIITNSTDLNGGKWNMMWSCHYYFRQQFGPKDF